MTQPARSEELQRRSRALAPEDRSMLLLFRGSGLNLANQSGPAKARVVGVRAFHRHSQHVTFTLTPGRKGCDAM